VFLEQAIIDDKRIERYWRQAHSTELIFPVSNFLGDKLNICSLNIIQAGRNVLDLHSFALERVELDDIAFEGKLLRVRIDHLYGHLRICGIL
jgi:hypothetical protein